MVLAGRKNGSRGRALFAALIGVVLLAGSVGGFGEAAAASPGGNALSIQAGVAGRTWTIESDEGEFDVKQTSFPLLIRTPLVSEGLRLSIFTAAVSSDVEGGADRSLGGAVDTRLRLNYLMPNDRVVLSGGVSLPTGQTDLDSSEVIVSRAVSNQILGFRTNRYGEGLDLSGNIAVAWPLNNQWSAGGGAGATLKGTFDYAPEALNGLGEVAPGNEFHISGGLSYLAEAGEASTAFNMDGTFRSYGTDEVEGEEVFQEGSEVELLASIARDGERWRLATRVRVLLKGDHKFFGSATEFTAESALENLILANLSGDLIAWRGGVTYRATPTIDVGAHVDVIRYDKATVEKAGGGGAVASRGEANIIEPGASLDWRASDLISLHFGASVPTGDAEDGAIDLSGFDFTVGATVRP